jgi:hypothetical protein
MGGRRASRADFEEFLAVCSDRLARTATLLACDGSVAERLLRSGLARAWAGWGRLDVPPELFVRRHLVEAGTRWWARRPRPRGGEDLWDRWTRLSAAQRAVAVLRLVDGLPEDDAAELLGCPARLVEPMLAQVRASLGAEDPVPGLLDALASRDDLPRSEGGALRARLAGVDAEAAGLRRHRRARNVLSAMLVVAVTVLGVTAVPRLVPDAARPPGPPLPAVPSPGLDFRPTISPPRLGDRQLPAVVVAGRSAYEYFASEQSAPRARTLRAAIAPSRQPQALAWVSRRGLRGEVVVSVDGSVVSRTPAGLFVSGLVVAARRPHLVVVRWRGPSHRHQRVGLGLAVYRWPDP